MFGHDECGRLTGAAPLVHILRTARGTWARVHADLPDALAERVQALAAAPRGRPQAWAQDYARLVELVAPLAAVAAVRAGPLYGFPPGLPEPDGCATLTAANVGLLADGLDEWAPDVLAGAMMAAALAEGRAAAFCASVRASPAVHCAGVETAPGRRGCGHGRRAVAAWAGLVRQAGAEPLYGTTFDNLPSQRLAAGLGLPLVGSEFSIYGAV